MMSRSDTLFGDQTPWPVGTFWRETARLHAAGRFQSRQKRGASERLSQGMKSRAWYGAEGGIGLA